MQKSDGMNYAPEGRPAPVVDPGEFPFAAVALDHGHIFGQCKGLTEAGGDLRYVFDPDPAKVAKFCDVFPSVQPMPSLEAVLEKPEIKLVAAAASAERTLRARAARHGRGQGLLHGQNTFHHARAARLARARSRRADANTPCYFSERLHVECAVCAGQLIAQGAIGRVVNVIGLGPHRSLAGVAAGVVSVEGKRAAFSRHRLASVRRSSSITPERKDAQVVNASVRELPAQGISGVRGLGRREPHRGQRRDELHSHRLAQSPTACGLGATGARSSSARMVTWSCGSI